MSSQKSISCGKAYKDCTCRCDFLSIIASIANPEQLPDSDPAIPSDIEPFIAEITGKAKADAMLSYFEWTDRSDILQYQTDPRLRATPYMLQRTFDYYLLSYCKMQYLKSKLDLIDTGTDSFYAVHEIIESAWQDELEKPIKRRKRIPSVLIPNRTYHYSRFSPKAKEDLLCKYLFFPKNATAQLFSLGTNTLFIDPISLDRRPSLIALPRKQHFAVDDYFFYEYFTGACLSLEITAALMECPESVRRLILSKLQSRSERLVRSPMLLTRSAIARQYVFEAKSVIEFGKLHFYQGDIASFGNSIGNVSLDKYVDAAFQRVDQFSQFLYNPYESTCYYSNGTRISVSRTSPVCPFDLADPDDLLARSNFFKQMLSSIKQPVDVHRYVSSPKYGPLAFCNTSHKNALEILDDVIIPVSKSGEVSIPRKRSKACVLFNEVQKMVIGAIENADLKLDTAFQ